jgi:hypothetical protein
MTAIISEAERDRRAEIIRDARAALQQGETLEQRTGEQKADAWANWFRRKIDSSGCAGPVELLPDACARLEYDRVAAAVAELKAALNYRDLRPCIDEVIDQVQMQNKRLQTELWNLVKTQLGDLRARVDGVLPDTKSALRVARERADEVSELPNPPPPRRTIN